MHPENVAGSSCAIALLAGEMFHQNISPMIARPMKLTSHGGDEKVMKIKVKLDST